MKNIFLLPIVLVQLFGCSHADREFENKISSQQCDEALKVHSDPRIKAENNVKYLANNIAAYSYITANYTAEVLWDVTAGTVTVVALCAPTAALSLTSRIHGSAGGSGFCLAPLDSALRYVTSPPLGRNSVKKTANMRCPNLQEMSHVIGRVVSCYENKGDTESLKKAVTSLENIEMSSAFFTCLPLNEQLAITARREELQRRTAKTSH